MRIPGHLFQAGAWALSDPDSKGRAQECAYFKQAPGDSEADDNGLYLELPGSHSEPTAVSVEEPQDPGSSTCPLLPARTFSPNCPQLWILSPGPTCGCLPQYAPSREYPETRGVGRGFLGSSPIPDPRHPHCCRGANGDEVGVMKIKKGFLGMCWAGQGLPV